MKYTKEMFDEFEQNFMIARQNRKHPYQQIKIMDVLPASIKGTKFVSQFLSAYRKNKDRIIEFEVGSQEVSRLYGIKIQYRSYSRPAGFDNARKYCYCIYVPTEYVFPQ